MLSKINFSVLNSLGTGTVKAGRSVYFVSESRPARVVLLHFLPLHYWRYMYTYIYTVKLGFP